MGILFGEAFVTFDTRTLIPNVVAALLGLGLNEAAYMAEIVRAGILSVDEGQIRGCVRPGHVPAPHAAPYRAASDARGRAPTGNETISMLKTTSLVVAVPYYELLFNAKRSAPGPSDRFPCSSWPASGISP